MQTSLRISDSTAGCVAPFATMLAEKRLRPRSPSVPVAHAAEGNFSENAEVRAFEDYLARAYERCSMADSEALHDPSRRLEDWYFPLKAKSSRITSPVLIDGYNRKLFAPDHERILLVGPPGSGKTTALRFLFLACIRANAGTPFYVQLRWLSPRRTVLDVIREELNAEADGLDNQRLLALIRRGGFVFLLDGLNEICPAHGQKVLGQFRDFVESARGNQIVLTARSDTPPTAAFDFVRLTLEPLALREAFDLIKRRGSHEGLAQHIIGKITKDTSRALREFLTNPLRAAMLYKSYELMRRACPSPPLGPPPASGLALAE